VQRFARGESRLARCLLQTRDLAGSDRLVLTQKSMAPMIGARRNSVSLVANTLQQAKFIHYSRGHIEIADPAGLSKTACDCYPTVELQYDRLLRSLAWRCWTGPPPLPLTANSGRS
jgi:Crp-like helix-turn-helix domain